MNALQKTLEETLKLTTEDDDSESSGDSNDNDEKQPENEKITLHIKKVVICHQLLDV